MRGFNQGRKFSFMKVGESTVFPPQGMCLGIGYLSGLGEKPKASCRERDPSDSS